MRLLPLGRAALAQFLGRGQAGALRGDQRGGDGTPLEDVGALLLEAGGPETALVGIGATRYTAVGETTFLARGDEALVLVYDVTQRTPEEVEQAVADGREDALPAASVVRQTVV